MVHHPNIPKLQLAILCALRVVDSFTFTQIFPYINQLLTRLNLVTHPSQIGLYSGLVESSFAFFQLCTIYEWAKLSDTVGRRPVILLGTFGLAFATVLLGLASSLPLILAARSLAGVFSGNAAVLHSVLGEITNASNQAIAFPIYGLFWPFGSILGPLVGGALANPAERFPHLFHHTFWKDYPYFLPSFVTGSGALIIAILATLLMEETLPSKRKDDATRISCAPSEPELLRSTSLECMPPNESFTMKELLKLPALYDLTTSGAALCFTATAFDAVFVLFCYTPVQDGGLGFSASEIGLALAIAATSSILLQIILLPPLLKTCSHGGLYYVCMFFWPVTYLAIPFLHLIARNGIDSYNGLIPRATYLLWFMIFFIMVLSRIGNLAYSISLTLVKQYSPSPEDLGKSNGIVLWGMCFARALAPAFVSSFFAWSIDRNVLGGYLWLLVMVLISLIGCFLSRGLAQPDRYPVRLPGI